MDKPEVLIVGGARTPMTDYVGALKDVSAIELGAIAARGAFEKTGVKPGVDRPRRDRQRHADQRRRRVRRAAHRAQGRRPGRRPGADRQSAVRLRHPGCGQWRADDSTRRGERRAHRRRREHESGAACHPRPSQRAEARTGQARGLAVGGAARHATAAARWRSPPRTAPPNTVAAAGPGRIRAAESAAGRQAPGARGGSPTKSCRSTSRRRKGVETVDRDDHMRPETTLEDLASVAGGIQERRLGDGRQCQRHRRRRRGADPRVARVRRSSRPGAARPARRVGRRWRRSGFHGHGTGARDACGARAHRPDARRSSISSRSTKRSPASISPSRRSSGSIATGSTSTAARSRSVIRSA